eukprot:XP_024302048.1 uncharacterized protein LOC112267855 isoform X1 [Homo sapiens]
MLLRRQSRSCWHVSNPHWALWAEGTVWPCCSGGGKQRHPDLCLSLGDKSKIPSQKKKAFFGSQDGRIRTAQVYSSQRERRRRRVISAFPSELLQMLFEEALPLSCSDPVLSTLSLVQFSPSGRTQDLLSPGVENLSVLDVSPLGLVVEDATEVEVSDSKAASELYLQATAGPAVCSLSPCPAQGLTLLRGPGPSVCGKGLYGSYSSQEPQTAPCCGCWLVKLLVRRRRALCPGLSHGSWKETTTVAYFFAWTPKVARGRVWSSLGSSEICP